MASDQARVEAIHAAQIRFRLHVEHPELRRFPFASQVNSQTVLSEGVLNPVGTRPVFHDDNDPSVVVEIPNGDTAALSRAPADCLDDQRVPSRVGRPRYARDDRRVRDGICYSDYGSRKSHKAPLCRLTDRRQPAGNSADRLRQDTEVCRQTATMVN